MSDPAETPAMIRKRIREGGLGISTAGLAPGYAQANLIVLPRGWADEFRTFCDRNPRPCPLLDVTDPGSPHPPRLANNADLRYDLSGYRVFRRGTWQEVRDLSAVWDHDAVGFLLEPIDERAQLLTCSSDAERTAYARLSAARAAKSASCRWSCATAPRCSGLRSIANARRVGNAVAQP